MISPARCAGGAPLGGVGQGGAQQRQREPHAGVVRIEQVGGHVQAAAAGAAGAGAHGQFGHGPAAVGGGFADLVVGDPVADADVHGDGGTAAGRTGPMPFNRGCE